MKQAANPQKTSPAGSSGASTPPVSGSAQVPSPVIPAPASNAGFFRGVAMLATVLISATAGLSLAMVLPLPRQLSPHDGGSSSLDKLWQGALRYSPSRPVNILVMGIDRVPDAKNDPSKIFSGRSDTLLLLRLDPTDDSVNLLSIPRDTQVDIPGVGLSKINHANVEGGPALAAQVVSNTLNGVPIDRYVRVSTDAFRELVDLLGGVRIYVPEDMSYTDQTQKLKIDLKQGWQTLNGDQAEQFARYRGDGAGDIGRVQRQQALLKALRGRLTSPTVIPRIPAILSMMQRYIDTNLTLEEMLALINLGLQAHKQDVRMVMLPGRFSTPDEFIASYWIMNPEGRDRVLQQYFKLDASMGSVPRAASSLRIAVQNASGEPSLGSEALNYLSNLGFYNAYLIEDWKDPQNETEIIVQQGDLGAATELRQVLGTGTVEAASTGDLESDLTLRVGRDWLTRTPSN